MVGWTKFQLMGCDEVVEDWSRVERENESKEIAIIKRPRSDNLPSPLPTFKVHYIIHSHSIKLFGYRLSFPLIQNNFFSSPKVRKEKLGDKITALQQLVSPFGKVNFLIFHYIFYSWQCYRESNSTKLFCCCGRTN